jgi:hypothetical protein
VSTTAELGLYVVNPQNPAVETEDVRAYRGRIEEMLKNPNCRDFLERLLNEAKTQTGKSYADILTTFNQIKFFWGRLALTADLHILIMGHQLPQSAIRL